jgi:ATP-dependent exoDNAse (exonuclease V) beta subunit
LIKAAPIVDFWNIFEIKEDKMKKVLPCLLVFVLGVVSNAEGRISRNARVEQPETTQPESSYGEQQQLYRSGSTPNFGSAAYSAAAYSAAANSAAANPNAYKRLDDVARKRNTMATLIYRMQTGLNHTGGQADQSVKYYKNMGEWDQTVMSTSKGMGFNTGKAKKADWERLFEQNNQWLLKLMSRRYLDDTQLNAILAEIANFFNQKKNQGLVIGFGENTMVSKVIQSLLKMDADFNPTPDY